MTSRDGAAEQAATPETVTLARLARGRTQAELAVDTGISQAYLSKVEKGAVVLSGARLEAVAGALGYPVSLFLLTPDDAPVTTACVFPRKRNSLPVSAERRVRALLDVTRLQVEALLDDDTPPVMLVREPPSDDGWVGPEDVAVLVRESLGAPAGPLINLTEALERVGVIVVARDLGSRRLDAIGQWPAGRRPLFLLSTHAPADRQRFTLAHELGHAVMHLDPRPDQEVEADRFAAELLLPASDIREELEDLDMSGLVTLKMKWRVSMAALVRRARDLGAISDYRYKQLNIDLSAAGYRTREPATFLPERPILLPSALERRLGAGQSAEALASRAHMLTQELSDLYLERRTA